MTDSIRLGRILGIPIGVNWSIVAVAALFTIGLALQALPRAAPDAELTPRLIAASVAVLVFFVSILAHEVGHAVAALAHGVGVHGITLWVLGGVAKLDRQAPTAKAEFQIAVAGPAVSFALGIFFVALTIIAQAVFPAVLVVGVLGWLGGVNLLLAVFNLLPAAPLDGGRVLTAALWKRLGDAEEARVISGRCGLFLAVGLVIIGGIQILFLDQFGGWVTVLVGAFTFTAARSEIAMAVLRRRLLTTPVGRLTVQHPGTVPDTVTVSQLVDWAGPGGSSTAHAVVRWDAMPIGYVVPSEAARGLSDAEQTWTRVGQLMHAPTSITRVASDTAVDSLLRQWDETTPAMAVVTDGPDGSAIGTITEQQVRPLLTPPNLWGRDRKAEPAVVAAAAPSGAPPPPPPIG